MSDDSTLPPRKRVKHFDNGEPHFLTFSCYRRLQLLSKDRTRRWLIDAIAEARTIHGFHLWAWVIMPEHVHLLLWPPFDMIGVEEVGSPGESRKGLIQGILSSIKTPVGMKGIAYLKKHAPEYLQNLSFENENRSYHRFWQAGSGYDENVCETLTLHRIIEYIHMNPVRRGLVERPEQWEWSSARDWMGFAGSPIQVDRTIPPLLEVPWKDRRAARGF
jgi:putative transposase